MSKKKFKSSKEEYVYNKLKELFPHLNIKTQYLLKNFEECPKSLSRTSIDIYIPDLKIGIEIDGEHHRHPVKYTDDIYARVNYETRVKLDRMKEAFLSDKIILLRVNTDIIESDTERLLNDIKTYLEETEVKRNDYTQH